MKCDKLKIYRTHTDNLCDNYIDVEFVDVVLKEDVYNAIAELKPKLEDAGMRERRMRRALYKALANWAHFAVAFFSSFKTKDKWHKMEHKCLKKAEEYE